MAVAATTKTGARPSRVGHRLSVPSWVGTVPFLAYVGIFLLWPTGIVVVDAFKNPNGAWAFSNFTELGNPLVRGYFIGSFKLCVFSSVVGAVLGAILAYAVASGDPDGVVRRLYLSSSGVLGQFGGVTLAFAFLVLIGPVGLLFHASWYFDFPWGIGLIYTYFQIPLMVLVILPALEGLRPAWREAAENLGARTWDYWRYVGGPVLLPSFLGCVLLLFGSALSAYATTEALTNGTIPLTAIQIGSFLNGNVIAGQENIGKALGLGMVVIIAVAMLIYVAMQRRAAKWLR